LLLSLKISCCLLLAVDSFWNSVLFMQVGETSWHTHMITREL
jgi:hypothetical protein